MGGREAAQLFNKARFLPQHADAGVSVQQACQAKAATKASPAAGVSR